MLSVCSRLCWRLPRCLAGDTSRAQTPLALSDHLLPPLAILLHEHRCCESPKLAVFTRALCSPCPSRPETHQNPIRTAVRPLLTRLHFRLNSNSGSCTHTQQQAVNTAVTPTANVDRTSPVKGTSCKEFRKGQRERASELARDRER